jgi:cyclopropane fatty-acyl-phospholipid synthase-like methyltransferase
MESRIEGEYDAQVWKRLEPIYLGARKRLLQLRMWRLVRPSSYSKKGDVFMNRTQSISNPYDDFYFKGGWKYRNWRERIFLVKRIIRPLKLQRGSKLLELGCGMGFHSNLFSKLGFEVVGIDLSEAGISYAKNHFSEPQFLNIDAAMLSSEFEYEHFDVIYVRGMSWYHYELNGVNIHGVNVPSYTQELFRFLTKNGIFILQIKTDFSGRRPDSEVHHNKLEDYIRLFSSFGEVVFISDLKGKILRNQKDAEKSRKSIIIATRKA